MPKIKEALAVFATIVWNVAVLVALAAAVAYGPSLYAYIRSEPMPWPIQALQLMQSWLLIWAVVLRLMHNSVRDRATHYPAYPAYAADRAHLRYVAGQLLVNSLGVIALCFVEMVMHGQSVFAYALAAGCIAMMLVSSVQTLRCLFGKDGELNDRRAPAQA